MTLNTNIKGEGYLIGFFILFVVGMFGADLMNNSRAMQLAASFLLALNSILFFDWIL